MKHSPTRKSLLQTTFFVCSVTSFLIVGYLLGSWHPLHKIASAQADNPLGLTDDSLKKIRTANEALKVAADALKLDNRYNPATKGMNTFMILTGGFDAVQELEAGLGVDPETYAGLYAGQAAEGIAEHLSRDEENHLLYKGKLVRLYKVSRLKELYAQRLLVSEGGK